MDITDVRYDSMSPGTIYWGESRELTFFVELKTPWGIPARVGECS